MPRIRVHVLHPIGVNLHRQIGKPTPVGVHRFSAEVRQLRFDWQLCGIDRPGATRHRDCHG